MLYNTLNPIEASRLRKQVEADIAKGETVRYEHPKLRTNKQNAYLHALLGIVAIETGNTLEWVKVEYYKKLVNPSYFCVEKNDPYVGKGTELKSSTELTTAEFAQTTERFKRWAWEEANIYLPSPDEDERIKWALIEIEKHKEWL